MRVLIFAVGRCRDPALRTLIARFCARLPWSVAVQEIELKGGDPARRRSEEGRAILTALPKDAPLIALDERGALLTSRDFAAHLARLQQAGVRTIAFAIGGADGLDPEVCARAALVLSLGRMTFPHELVRLLLVEQLYRAFTILKGHPYHRD